MSLFSLLACASLLPTILITAEPPPPNPSEMRRWTPQQRAVAFMSVEKFAPVAVVRRGAAVRALPLAETRLGPAFAHDGRTYDVASFMTAQDISGLLVLKDGEIVLEQYGLGRGPQDRWISFSVTKSITSTLIGAAIRDGRIRSLDDKVVDYIPEMAGSAYDGVTVRHLLTMSSGVKWNEDYADPDSDVGKVGGAVTEPGVNPIVSYMRRLPRQTQPGAAFAYNTGETDLAGILLSRAVGEPIADYLSKKIWARYGMEQDAVWMRDAGGHERGGCCISMTLRDYARIGQFMIDSQDVTPEGWVDEATSPLLPTGQPERESYGYFWWTQDDGAFAAIGIHGQGILVYPKERLVVAVNSAWRDARSAERYVERDAFIKAIRAALSER